MGLYMLLFGGSSLKVLSFVYVFFLFKILLRLLFYNTFGFIFKVYSIKNSVLQKTLVKHEWSGNTQCYHRVPLMRSRALTKNARDAVKSPIFKLNPAVFFLISVLYETNRFYFAQVTSERGKNISDPTRLCGPWATLVSYPRSDVIYISITEQTTEKWNLFVNYSHRWKASVRQN